MLACSAAMSSSQSSAVPSHAVAIIGGATAGAEVADRLAKAGVEVYVLDQNPRPYGKIEDGLPRWHSALRNKEYANIREKLDQPGVHFLPNTKVGKDVSFDALAKEWGFSAVVLACGAWRDRPLPVPNADDYVGKGLLYQNPFIIAFNHKGDPHYTGEHYESMDGAVVVGGGLASIDVAKVLSLEVAQKALAARGHHVEDLEEFEKKGIPKQLEEFGLKYEDLGLKGLTLLYRRNPEDMPLMAEPPDATPERMEKVKASRKKILEKAMEKFCFTFEGLSAPEKLIIEEGRVAGLVARKVRQEGKKLVPTDELNEYRTPLIVSSIGSIPEPMPGLKMNGELFPFTDWDLGRLDGYPNVFSAGNVVTGKGNIIASRKHASQIGEHLVEQFLGLGDPAGRKAAEEELFEGVASKARAQAEGIAKAVAAAPRITEAALTEVRRRARVQQDKVGFKGSFSDWIAKVSG